MESDEIETLNEKSTSEWNIIQEGTSDSSGDPSDVIVKKGTGLFL